MDPISLLLLFSGTISLLGVSGLALARRRSRQARLRNRFDAMLQPHVRERDQAPPPSVILARPMADRSIGYRLLRLFGVDPARTTHLPLRWPVLLGLCLAIGGLPDLVAQMMIGGTALLFVPVSWVLTSRMVFGWFSRRHMQALFSQFPDALAMIVRAVRIGIPPSQAIQSVAREAPAPTAAAFTRLTDDLSIGKPLDEAVGDMAERTGLPEYRFFAAALSLQNQTGGGLAQTLENLGEVIRKRVYARAKGHALAAEARMSALVLTILPVFTFFALLLLSPAYVWVLLSTRGGHMVFGMALMLLAVGQGTMRFLIRKSLS
jgi:tight adherence protein B